MDGNTLSLVLMDGIVFMFLVGCLIVAIAESRDQKTKGRINEKNLMALKKYLKKSTAIDQQQADRISLLLEESLYLLHQKKISQVLQPAQKSIHNKKLSLAEGKRHTHKLIDKWAKGK